MAAAGQKMTCPPKNGRFVARSKRNYSPEIVPSAFNRRHASIGGGTAQSFIGLKSCVPFAVDPFSFFSQLRHGHIV